MSNTQKIVHLRIYQGREMSYDANGNPQNYNQVVKLVYDIPEWHNYLKNMSRNGLCKVEVEDYTEGTPGGEYNKKPIPKEIKQEVHKAFTGEDYIEESKPSKSNDTDNADDGLAAAKAEYKEVFGKKPHHSWDEEKIRSLIKEKEDE